YGPASRKDAGPTFPRCESPHIRRPFAPPESPDVSSCRRRRSLSLSHGIAALRGHRGGQCAASAAALSAKQLVEHRPQQRAGNRSDRHILMIDTTNNTLYELYNVFYNGTNWEAYSGAFFDMKTNNRRTEGWTSADAAGLAIFPGLVRYDEAYGPDEIRHALRVTVSSTNGHVFPASHTAGTAAGALPMGARLRLKPGTNISYY